MQINMLKSYADGRQGPSICLTFWAMAVFVSHRDHHTAVATVLTVQPEGELITTKMAVKWQAIQTQVKDNTLNKQSRTRLADDENDTQLSGL